MGGVYRQRRAGRPHHVGDAVADERHPRDIQSEGGITAAQFRPFDEDVYSAADVYRAGSAAYWQAVDASRQHTATLARILRRTDRLIRLSFILLGILAILLFLLT